MKFTPEKPTVPGDYRWRHVANPARSYLVELDAYDIQSLGNCIGKEWSSRLVPCEEVEKAYYEGGDSLSVEWEQSRARRVVEGRE